MKVKLSVYERTVNALMASKDQALRELGAELEAKLTEDIHRTIALDQAWETATREEIRSVMVSVIGKETNSAPEFIETLVSQRDMAVGQSVSLRAHLASVDSILDSISPTKDIEVTRSDRIRAIHDEHNRLKAVTDAVLEACNAIVTSADDSTSFTRGRLAVARDVLALIKYTASK